MLYFYSLYLAFKVFDNFVAQGVEGAITSEKRVTGIMRIKFFALTVIILTLWNYIMIFYQDSLLEVMPWWAPLVIDLILGFLSFYTLLGTTIELISK